MPAVSLERVSFAHADAVPLLEEVTLRLPAGWTAVVGENVTLHQGVTLGASELEAASGRTGAAQRHPIIESNVVIHAGATILGRVVIGRDSVIGGNVWLTHDVPPGSTVTQAESRKTEG